MWEVIEDPEAKISDVMMFVFYEHLQEAVDLMGGWLRQERNGPGDKCHQETPHGGLSKEQPWRKSLLKMISGPKKEFLNFL